MHGNCRLACSAFLADNSDCFHVFPFFTLAVAEHKRKHTNMQVACKHKGEGKTTASTERASGKPTHSCLQFLFLLPSTAYAVPVHVNAMCGDVSRTQFVGMSCREGFPFFARTRGSMP